MVAETWKQYGLPRYRGLPDQTRWIVGTAIAIVLAIVLFFVDHSLGYAVLTIAALWWLRHVPPLPRPRRPSIR